MRAHTRTGGAFAIVVVVAFLSIVVYQRHLKTQVCTFVEHSHAQSNLNRGIIIRFLSDAAHLRRVYALNNPAAPDAGANVRAAHRWLVYAQKLGAGQLATKGC